MKFSVLAGGVGAARFLSGFVRVARPESISAIVNTGDDTRMFGLLISPDIDIVTYTLAGLVHDQGWGLKGDTFDCLETLKTLGHDTWFNLGDRDLAVHIHRTQRLVEGKTLSAVTDEVRRQFGVKIRILPMSDQPVATKIDNGMEILAFQEYFVHRRASDPVRRILFEGIDEAKPAPDVTDALKESDGIVFAPSNPLVSIGTILAVKGIKEAIMACGAPKIAISPIVGGATIKGPAADMMRTLGHEVSSLGVAKIYKGLVDVFIIDTQDAAYREAIENLGMRVIVRDTVMCTDDRKIALARAVLSIAEEAV